MAEHSATPEPQADVDDGRPLRSVNWALRVLILVPFLAMMATSLALIAYSCLDAWQFVTGVFDPENYHPRDELVVHAIEMIDHFLLATVIQVIALGLFQLYFTVDLKLPPWLRIKSLEELKHKLIGVTITVLAVNFLGRALTWEQGVDIAYIGIAIAVVIAALTWFLRAVGTEH